jgi:CubicO group peptidase (beta-lactamase class C family)
MSLNLHVIDAFTNKPLAGNSAALCRLLLVGVLLLAGDISVAQTRFDTNRLDALVQAAKQSQSDALIVWQDGRPLLEWYGDGKARKIEAMSATKSVVSLAVGRLLTQTKIRSLDQPVADFYPEWKQGQKAKITIRHLMNHTSGLQNVPIATQEIYPSPDFVQLALCAELKNPPGTTFSYNNKAANLLAGVVEKASGKRLDDYLRDELFTSLGITDFTWTRDRAGNPHGMSGLQILPVDLAKLGQLVLNRGQWNGQTLIEASFFDAALQPGQPLEASCGLLWWLMYDRKTGIVDEQQLQKLRAAGVTPSWLEKIKGAQGQYTSDSEFAVAMARVLGANWLDESNSELNKHGFSLRDLLRQEHGKIIGYQANGYLGQYLLIYPDARLVCVRMIESKSTYNPTTDGGEDLVKLIRSTVVPVPGKKP